MNLTALAVLLLPTAAMGATVEGAYFHLSADDLRIDSVLSHGSEPLIKARKVYATHGRPGSSFTDYYVRRGDGRAFIRDGDANFLDPVTMDAPVDFFRDDQAEGIRIQMMVCRYKDYVAAAVMLSHPPIIDGAPPETPDFGVYYSVQAADFHRLAVAFDALFLASEFKLRDWKFESLQQLGLRDSIRPLEEFIEEEANKSVDPTPGTAPRSSGSQP